MVKALRSASPSNDQARTKAYSYLRFSTPEQAAGDSRRRQTEMAERYAKAHDLDLDNQLTFQDLGISAFSGANLRGQLGAFLSAVQSKLVSPGFLSARGEHRPCESRRLLGRAADPPKHH